MAEKIKHTYVTESNIPFEEAFYMTDRFMFLNMYPDGIWYVDTHCSKWEDIKQTAIQVAKTFGDTDTLEKLQNHV